jgi:serine/threonine protein kinase
MAYCARAAESSEANAEAEACVMCGRAYQEGICVPVDRVVSASYFQRAALLGNSRAQNAIGKCLEDGMGIDQNISMAITYYKAAATQGDPDGANNYGLALESGRVDSENANANANANRNEIQAAKYYRFASDRGHADGANNYGICLERGFGVKRDPENAAKFYRLAAERGHADGMNNFGLCLEHGLGIDADLAEARRYYSMAMKLNHAEAAVNYRRCCRLLGEWAVPLRSPTEENLTEESFQRFQSTVPAPDRFLPEIRAPRSAADLRISLNCSKVTRILGGDSLYEVKLHETAGGGRHAVKIVRWDADLEADITALVQLEHPCVLPTDGFARVPNSPNAAVVTALMENGALHENIRPQRRGELPRLRSPTKISKIVAAVVLGMRFMHSQGAVHGHLTPANILLDRRWRVRIADFGSSHFRRDSQQPFLFVGDPRYLPREDFEGDPPSYESDVYSFGLILYELMTGRPRFSPDLPPLAVMREVLMGSEFDFPPRVNPAVAALIERCCSDNCEDRPPFDEIFSILKGMNFRIARGVRAKKVEEFVSQIEKWEERRAAVAEGGKERGGRNGRGIE